MGRKDLEAEVEVGLDETGKSLEGVEGGFGFGDEASHFFLKHLLEGEFVKEVVLVLKEEVKFHCLKYYCLRIPIIYWIRVDNDKIFNFIRN